MLERVGAKALDECARLVDVAGAIETDAVEELLALVGLDDVRLTSAAVVAEPDGDGAVVISLDLGVRQAGPLDVEPTSAVVLDDGE